jgi:hypothetical protein
VNDALSRFSLNLIRAATAQSNSNFNDMVATIINLAVSAATDQQQGHQAQ